MNNLSLRNTPEYKTDCKDSVKSLENYKEFEKKYYDGYGIQRSILSEDIKNYTGEDIYFCHYSGDYLPKKYTLKVANSGFKYDRVSEEYAKRSKHFYNSNGRLCYKERLDSNVFADDITDIFNDYCDCWDDLEDVNVETFGTNCMNRSYVLSYSSDPCEILDGSMVSHKSDNIKKTNWDSMNYNDNGFKGSVPYPLFGIELEVEQKRESDDTELILQDTLITLNGTISYAEARENHTGFAIIKSDSSIRNYGFEIVTLPSTLNAHKVQWHNFFNNVASRLSSYTSGRCGMHIHISKNCFTPLHMGKFANFFNTRDNRKLITRISGRSVNDYCYFNEDEVDLIDNSDLDKYSSGRSALTLSESKPTIEIRSFRGNVSKIGFFKNLEFTHALWTYTKDCGISELYANKFIEWFKRPSNNKLYPNLRKWFTATGVIPRTERTVYLRERKEEKQYVLNSV